MESSGARRWQGPVGPVRPARLKAAVELRYYREKSKVSHGWNIYDRSTGIMICWLSDAVVADRVLAHLNQLV